MQQTPSTDTGIVDDPVEDEIISEVIKTKTPPQKKKCNILAR